jgi:hypothetical protein
MYKKITHNIVEEHFAHPEAVQVKSQLGYYRKTTTPAPNPASMMSDQAQQFKTAAHKLLGNYARYISSSINGILDSSSDLTAIGEKISKDISAIGAVMHAYYSESVGDQTVTHLKKIANDVAEIARLVKSNKSIDQIKTNLLQEVDSFATLLESVNPGHWPATAVRDYFGRAVDAWIGQTQARDRKKWDEAIAFADRVMDIFIGSGTGMDGEDFAKIFAEGIIRQFPDQFIRYPIPV